MRKLNPLHIILAVFLMLLLIGFFLAYASSVKPEKYVEINNKKIVVEIADDPQEWSQGLMFRDHLDENKGMLFIFPTEELRSFWMKNTLIPLDIIFISSNFTIVDIKENFEPCKSEPCPSYASKGEAKYVLEVNSGFTQENGIKAGTAIKIQ